MKYRSKNSKINLDHSKPNLAEQNSTNNKNHQEVRMTRSGRYEIEKRFSFYQMMEHFFHLRQFEATVSWRSCTKRLEFKQNIYRDI